MNSEKRLDSLTSAWLGDQSAVPGENSDALLDALDELYLAGPADSSVKQAMEALRGAIAQVELFYGVLSSSPVGKIFVALSQAGLVAVDFGVTEADFLSRLRAEQGAEPVRDDRAAGEALKQLREYLSGERESFDLPVDLTRQTEFQRRVLRVAQGVPRGGLSTYGEIARALGKPQAARAVGQALARNPVPIVIPCHRVVAADGALTGYSGGRGISTKEALLKLEGALPG